MNTELIESETDLETSRLKKELQDAILFYCEKETIDVESIPKLMTKPLKEKLKVDATNLNFMKARGQSKAKLPI